MSIRVINADVLEGLAHLADESVHCCVTSPPYWRLRDYGYDGQIGLEPTIDAHVAKMVEVFREVRRVLRKDGTLWLNYGDMWAGSWGAQSRGSETAGTLEGRSQLSARQITAGRRTTRTGSMGAFGGLKPKDLVLMPERIALALQAEGWWVRDRVIWHKPNPMPSSVKDRCTPAHETVWHMSKSARYYHDAEAIAEPRTSDEDANGFRGGSYTCGEPGPRQVRGNRAGGTPATVATARGIAKRVKVPGRTVGQYVEARPPGTAPQSGLNKNEQQSDRRRSGFNDRWDEGEPDAPATRNRRNVWTIATEPYKDGHFATMPTELARLGILAGCPRGGTVLDPFAGAGTTGIVADRMNRSAILIEMKGEYVDEHILPRVKRDRKPLVDLMDPVLTA